MPAKCSFYKCKNSVKNRPTAGFRFFRFPKQLAHQWVKNCGNPDLIGLSPTLMYKNRVVCQDHFRPQDILPSGRLFPGAVPLPYNHPDVNTTSSMSDLLTGNTLHSTSSDLTINHEENHPPRYYNAPSSSYRASPRGKFTLSQTSSPNEQVLPPVASSSFSLTPNKNNVSSNINTQNVVEILTPVAERPGPNSSVHEESIATPCGKFSVSEESVTTPCGSFSLEKSSFSTSHWIDISSPNSPGRPTLSTKRSLFKQPLVQGNPQMTQNANKKKINLSRAQVFKLKRNLIKAKTLMKHGKTIDVPLKTKEAATLINMQFHKNRKSWSKNEKRFSLGLYLRSPSAYRYLNQKIHLPGVSTIKKWLAEQKIFKTGFCPEIMNKLKIKASSMNEMEKSCVLMFDAMSIKQQLEYSQAQDLIEGFQDLGPFGRDPLLGKQALVLMLRGLYYQWKLPVAYFISETTIPGEQLSFIIDKAVDNLSAAGLSVKAVVCDQGTSNTKAFNDLGASTESPYFLKNKNDKVFTVYDTPHLIKSLRNNFLTHDFLYKGNRVSFSDVKKLYSLECSSTTTRAAHQLTPAHLWPNNFQKMNVALATQIFSHTTASALRTAVATGQIQSSTASHTADFLSEINTLFDAMNSRKFKVANPDNCALSKGNKHIVDILKQGVEDFKDIKKIDAKFPRPPCFTGFICSIRATLQLFESEDCKYLLTSRLNQDPLENLFSSIRQRGGFNRNPSVKVFRGNLRVFTLKQMMDPPKTTSYDPDEDQLLEIHTLDQDKSTVEPLTTMPPLEDEWGSTCTAPEEEISCQPIFQDRNVVTLETCSQVYFAGYLAHNYHKKNPCQQCLNKLINPDSQLKSKKELLILNKSFTNIKIDSSSGLFSPSESLIYVADTALRVFSMKFREIAHRENVVANLISETENCVALDSLTCSKCDKGKLILQTLFTVLIHKQCKWISSAVKKSSLDKIKVLKHV